MGYIAGIWCLEREAVDERTVRAMEGALRVRRVSAVNRACAPSRRVSAVSRACAPSRRVSRFGLPGRDGEFAGLVAPGFSEPTVAYDRNSNEGGALAVFQGQLHNASEVLAELRRGGVRAEDTSDAGIVLAAYRHWGHETPRHLIGEYVFVVWDCDRREVFIARDPSQAFPLYYAFVDGQFAFASDLRLLLDLPSLSGEYDLTYLTTCVALEELNWDRTPYKEIRQIPGGYALQVSATGHKIWQWWQLPEPGSIRYRTMEDYHEHLRSLVREAVLARIRSSGPVTIALSSGIDSGCIAATAMNIVRNGDAPCSSVQAITIGPKAHPEADESAGAAAVAERLGMRHYVVEPEPFRGDLRPVATELVRPSSGAFLYRYWKPFQEKCDETGSTVVLTGSGGNELFSVNADYLGYLARQRRIADFVRELWRWHRAGKPLRETLFEIIYFHKRTKATQFAEESVALHPWLRYPELFHTDFASKQITHPLVRERYANFVEVGRPHECMQAFFSSSDIAVRDPLWDRRIVEFVAALPLDLHVPNSAIRKPLLRNAFARDIPLGLQGATGFLNAYLHTDLYTMWAVMCEVVEKRSDVLGTVFDMDTLRGNTKRLRMDASDYGPFLSTYVLTCWLDAAEQRREAGLVAA